MSSIHRERVYSALSLCYQTLMCAFAPLSCFCQARLATVVWTFCLLSTAVCASLPTSYVRGLQGMLLTFLRDKDPMAQEVAGKVWF